MVMSVVIAHRGKNIGKYILLLYWDPEMVSFLSLSKSVIVISTTFQHKVTSLLTYTSMIKQMFFI